MRRPRQIDASVLALDCATAASAIEASIRDTVLHALRRKGAVVGISGGIDSSVVAALCARALGPDHILGLLTPERESADDTLVLSHLAGASQGIAVLHEDITGILEAVGCYARRDAAIRSVIPEYTSGWKSKIVLPSLVEGQAYRIFTVVAMDPGGREVRRRLPLAAYLELIAAVNFKQRTRKMVEYYHADRLGYAVAGTPNRLEYDQGFFVKSGDGQADLKPIAHLYKSQVYQLAEYLAVPAAIRSRPPTTDTYSLPQGQDEFYFSLPYDKMDLCLYAKNHGYPPASLEDALALSAEQIERVYRDIDNKRRAGRYQHLAPVLVAPVREIEALLHNAAGE